MAHADDKVAHLAIEFASESAFDAAATGWRNNAPVDVGRPPVRYNLPGSAMLALSVRLMQALDTLKLAVTAFNQENPSAARNSLTLLMHQLGDMHETLNAVAEESPQEDPHGRNRPC